MYDICVEASKWNRNVSYHFRKRNIVVISSVIMQESPSYPTSPIAVLMTPEIRLQQLEDMKHLLSAQEYDDTRSIILAAI